MTSNGLVPLIRYRDVAAAVDWLSNAFGFEKRSIITDPDGTVAYAELSYGRGIVMLGPVGESVLDSLMKQPDELGGLGTQSVYVAVDDVEGHFNRARTTGAEIVLEFGSDEAGDRAYAARDPEGHIWNFGAYSPWPTEAVAPLPPAAEPAFALRPARGQAVLGGTVAALAIASIAGIASLEPAKPVPRFAAVPVAPIAGAATSAVTGTQEAEVLKETLARESHARQVAARTAAAIREELAREKAQRLAAETARRDLQKQLAAARAATPPASLAAIPADPPASVSPATGQSETPAAPVAAANPSQAMTDPPTTTGSIGDQPRAAALEPTAEEPALPVTIAPATPQVKPAPAASAPAAKPKPSRPRAQSKKKPKPAPKKTTGNNPFFMYD